MAGALDGSFTLNELAINKIDKRVIIARHNYFTELCVTAVTQQLYSQDLEKVLPS